MNSTDLIATGAVISPVTLGSWRSSLALGKHKDLSQQGFSLGATPALKGWSCHFVMWWVGASASCLAPISESPLPLPASQERTY